MSDFNKQYLALLRESVLINPRDFTENEKKSQNSLDTTYLEDLNMLSSGSFLTPNYKNKIGSVLSDPAEFKKLI
jgi:hypothetical protein